MWRKLALVLLALIAVAGGVAGCGSSQGTTSASTLSPAPTSEHNEAVVSQAREEARLEGAVSHAFESRVGWVVAHPELGHGYGLPRQSCHHDTHLPKFISCPCTVHNVFVSPVLIEDYENAEGFLLDPARTAAVIIDGEEGDKARCVEAAASVMATVH
jgi:hypothetical protein